MTPAGARVLEASSFRGAFHDVTELPQEPPVRNQVYAFRAGGGRYVLKVYESPAQWRNEVTALDALEGAGVPAVHDRGGPDGARGGWAVLTWLPGGAEWLREGGVPAEVPAELGRRVAAMHAAARGAPVGSLWDPARRYADWASYVDARFEESFAYVASRGLCPPPLLARARDRHEALREHARGAACALVHRDLRPANIRVAAEGGGHRVGVIDFEHAMVGDPWLDLSRLHEELLAGRPWIAEAFWAGYGPDADAAERGRRLAAYDVLRHLGGVRFAHATDDAPFLAESLERLREDCA